MERMEWSVCVLRGVEERPIYSSRGRFPANAHMEGDQVLWQPLLEVHLDENQARFGQPMGPADRPHLEATHAYPLLAG